MFQGHSLTLSVAEEEQLQRLAVVQRHTASTHGVGALSDVIMADDEHVGDVEHAVLGTAALVHLLAVDVP